MILIGFIFERLAHSVIKMLSSPLQEATGQNLPDKEFRINCCLHLFHLSQDAFLATPPSMKNHSLGILSVNVAVSVFYVLQVNP